MLDYLWLIPFLPLLSFAVIAVFLFRVHPRFSGYTTIGALAISCVLAWMALAMVIGEQGRAAQGETYHQEVVIAWFVGGGAEFFVGWLLDPLTAVMLVVVTTVSLLIQIYSQGYMRGDPGYRRYFAFMSLFTMSMLGLVLANNFLELYIFWELVGLCSYLLIGFWYQRPAAAAAAKKAFIVTRLGDLGFLVGILLIYFETGTFSFGGVEEAVKAGTLAGATLTAVAVLVFCGAVGKSAQFPLHVWLPDAMEGPTPVSALIHAATMVAAGVYLVARTFDIFSHTADAMLLVATIGAFTAFFAATMGVVMRDIKRVLAYSTISQLGYMMLGLGVGSFGAGVFHLMNHAFFKALLFLGAGSVIHAAGEQDLFRLGGLGRKMRITAITFTIGSLSLAGFPLFSGFWSKDEILAAAFHKAEGEGYYYILFGLGLFTAFLTAFYVFRACFLAFFGERRGAMAAHAGTSTGGHGGAHGEVHESPAVMTVPLLLLAIPAVLSGFLGSPLLGNAFGSFLESGEAHAEVNWLVMGSSSILALLGIALAWAMYVSRVISAETVSARFQPIFTMLTNKYWMDDLYNGFIRWVVLGVSQFCSLFDQYIVDGIVNGVAYLLVGIGWVTRRAETGRMPNYALAIFLGAAVIVGWLVWWPPG